MNKAAQTLGRLARGVPKTMSDAAVEQRRAASAARWSKPRKAVKRK